MSLFTCPSGTMLVDTNAKLTAQSATSLSASDINGKKVRGIFRYVGLHGPSAGDITADERSIILAAGLALGLVQHCPYPNWTADKATGAFRGKVAASCALSAGYAKGAHLALDLEGVANSGADVEAYCEAWAAEMIAAGYLPLLYVGYACGLTPDELWGLPSFHAYWSDAGPRNVSQRGFCCKQQPQISLPGLPFAVDPDLAKTDALGGNLILEVA